MKKKPLLKAIVISFLIMILLSWIIVGGSYSGSTYSKFGLNPVGIFDIFKMPLVCFTTFIQYGLLVLSIGIFYSILNKTGVYSKLIDKIVNKFKNKQKLFLILTIVVLCLISSITGLTLPLFILVPFLFNVLILLGYNKITSFAGTIGSILVGNICSLYGSSITMINNSLFGLDVNKEIFVKIIFLIMIVFLFVDLVVLKKRKDKKEKENIELLFYEKSASKKKVLPLVILGIITIIITILGMYNIDKVFGITLFTDIYNNLMSFEINGFHLFEKLFGGLVVFGSWTSYELSTFIIIMSLIISWVYSLKIKTIIEGFKEGICKFYKIALYAILANIVFTIILNTGYTVMATINNLILGGTTGFSIIKTSLATLSGSLFYNDYSWLMNSGIGNVLKLSDVSSYSIIALILNGIFSLVMLIIPTSVLLVTGLKFSDIDYKNWIKYIWKYLLIILGLLLVIAVILFKFL